MEAQPVAINERVAVGWSKHCNSRAVADEHRDLRCFVEVHAVVARIKRLTMALDVRIRVDLFIDSERRGSNPEQKNESE